jgi:hypothetical protein
MPTISGVSANALASLSSTLGASAGKAAAPKAATAAGAGVETQDKVQLSAETKAELAQGKPLFATDAAEAGDSADAKKLVKERAQKAKQLDRLDQKAGKVEQKAKVSMEHTKKRAEHKTGGVGDRMKLEEARKSTLRDKQVDRLGSQEERAKGQATDKTAQITEQAKKSGTPVDQDRLDRIGDRVKDEKTMKSDRLGAADERRIGHEQRVKAQAKDKVGGIATRTEEQQKRIAGNSEKKLSGLEERMKKLDSPKADPSDEKAIKG